MSIILKWKKHSLEILKTSSNIRYADIREGGGVGGEENRDKVGREGAWPETFKYTIYNLQMAQVHYFKLR